MTPNLLLCPDTQSQLPVISVSVIRAILGKIEPALKHGNTTPALSLVDLSKSSEAFELSGRSEARRIPALSSRALEGPILAGGGARGRMPWIPVARELLHGGVPHPPNRVTLALPSPLVVGHPQNQNTVIYQKRSQVSFVTTTTTTTKHPQTSSVG